MAKGQASVELITILAVALFTIIMFMALAANFLTDTNVQKNYETARDSVQRLAQAADSVYSQGEGASAIVQITLPTSTIFDSNVTFIGKPANATFAASSNTINIKVWDSDTYAITHAPLHGSFPATHGTYSMRVYSEGSYVVISPHIMKLDKYSLFVSMAKGETRNEVLQVSRLASAEVPVTAALAWGFSDIAISVPQGTFYPGQSGTPLGINITANTTASGLYSSELVLSGTGQDGQAEVFTVPITVDVH